MQRKKEIIELFVCIGAILLVFWIFDLPCIIKLFTGVSCPGCGMTRAYMSLLRLDFASAFYYHPLWLLVLIWVGIYALVYFKFPRAKDIVVAIGVLALLVTYIIRWFLGPREIVNYDFEATIYYKIYSKICEVVKWKLVFFQTPIFA